MLHNPYGYNASRRSVVMAPYGMVATSQPLAAQAGIDILKAGGNAIDAAIAVNATLGVVETEQQARYGAFAGSRGAHDCNIAACRDFEGKAMKDGPLRFVTEMHVVESDGRPFD